MVLVLILALTALSVALTFIYIFAPEEKPEEKPGRELAIAISPDDGIGAPGSELHYTITITNRGTENDIYMLAVSDNFGWGFALSHHLPEVSAGENEIVTLSVIIPENAAPRSLDGITVTATSLADPTAIENAGCIARTGAGVLTIARSADADILDPARTVYDPATRVTGLIYESLITLNWDMNHIPMLAESWEYNKEEMFYEFKLKHDVKFHCGYPFTAEAVRYTINRLKHLPGSKHTQSVQKILDVVVVDDYTVRIYLREEDRYLFDWFATVSSVIVCPHCVEEYGYDFGTPTGPPCGTGPFKYKDWVWDDRITLERYGNYTWGPERYQNKGPAHLDRIVFRVVPEDLLREAMFEQGEVDFVTSVRYREFDPNIKLYMQPVPSLVYLGFNCAGTEDHGYGELSGRSVPKKVRQAIAHAIDRDEIIVLALEGLGTSAHSWLADLIWSSTNYQENMYPHNPEKARELLSEAGYEDGLELEIIYSYDPNHQNVCMVLKRQLENVGITLNIQNLQFSALQARVNDKDYDMFIMGYTWPFADMIWWEWHTSRIPSPNRFWWGDAYTDALIDNTWSFNDEVAVEALHESQRLIAEDAASIGLYQRVTLMAHRTYVKGFNLHPLAGGCWKFLDTYKE